MTWVQRSIRPPRVPVLVLSQPFEFWISFSLLFAGVRSALSNEASFAALLDNTLAKTLLIAWQIGIVIACLAILASFAISPIAARRGEQAKARGRAVEKMGLVLMATSAGAYTVAGMAVVSGLNAAFMAGAMAGIILACGTRMVALRRIDKVTLHHLRRANGEIA